METEFLSSVSLEEPIVKDDYFKPLKHYKNPFSDSFIDISKNLLEKEMINVKNLPKDIQKRRLRRLRRKGKK